MANANQNQKELQLLPSPPSDPPLNSIIRKPPPPSDPRNHHHHDLDLKLSLPAVRSSSETIRMAAVEKAYAERVRELTRREMELAQYDFARARHMWQRAREEVERAERLRVIATRRLDGSGGGCMEEITCQSCRQRFRP